MKYIYVIVGALIICGAFYIDSLLSQIKHEQQKNLILQGTIEEQKQAIIKLEQVRQLQLDTLKDLDYNKTQLENKYKNLDELLGQQRDLNETDFINSFSTIVDKLWD